MAQATVPLGYKGVPSDIVNTVMFLVSDESRYMTGAELVVDGGMSIQ
jgi:NAD(P)-dependent dehydrogenase (short-subunit alcohol dehydrogenase family)